MKPIDPTKMTSVEAAQEFLDAAWEEQNTLNMDGLQRAHLRRMMGFDWRMKQQPNKVHVSSTEQPYVTTWCKFKGEWDEEQVDKLIDACYRLKLKYDAAKAKEQNL